MSRDAELHNKIGILLERTANLPKLQESVTTHEEKWKNLENNVLPPINSEIESSKKRKWYAEGVRGVVAFLLGLAGASLGGK